MFSGVVQVWALPGLGSCDPMTKDWCVCFVEIHSLGLCYDFHLSNRILVVPSLA